MRIIIAGAGDVGYHLAKLLAYEDQEIVLIDLDQEKLNIAANHLDVFTIRGSSTSYRVLEEADIANADMLISVTSSEEANLTTAIIGKHLGAKQTIARIQNVEYLYDKEKLDLKNLGIDELISPESLAAREIKRLLKDVALTDTFEFDNGELTLVGVHIGEESPFVSKTMEEVSKQYFDMHFLTVAILRNNETIIPHGKHKFQVGDHAYFISLKQGVDQILRLSGRKEKKLPIKNVMVLGGSKAGIHAARRLSGKYAVKLLEQNKEKCLELADELKDVMVINGDARDVDLLDEEGIDNMDAFIAVTGNSETNIISCLVAKNRNVRKTIALVENIDYIHLSQNIGVDTMINKKLIAANFIFRYIREGEIVSLTSIHGVDAEILEFIVQAGSKITRYEIKDLKFPSNAIIGGVVRNNVGIIATGSFQFRPMDRAVVLCRPECIHAVEEYFK
ncbi:MAG: Trk system potassium transporter TrkA [Cyclobacteriaceae bacterium]|nr:Trk system potassium transporter TrkA [Cyclobacteriaceae bacterium]